MSQTESPVLGILFCEFHPIQGPKIIYQVPEKFMSGEKFQSLNAYIIPKNELQGRLITVNSLGYKILGYPVGIDGKKFARNRYIFNLCFVCEALKRTVQYEPLVKKLARYFAHLETECAFLSTDESKAGLPRILSQIRDQLNSNERSCCLNITHSTTIHLKVVRVYPDPRPVLDHEVPILKKSIIPSEWDLTTQQVLPYINGERHVAKIATDADVEVSLVKACIQNMIYYGVARLIPIFLFSNVYVTTPQLVNLTTNPELSANCLKFVAKKDKSPPAFRAVFQVYSSMRHGFTVKDIVDRFKDFAYIDVKQLITFGLLHGFIRRLQRFPVLVVDDPATLLSQRGVYRFFDGKHSVDEICSKNCKSARELEEKINKHPLVFVIWK